MNEEKQFLDPDAEIDYICEGLDENNIDWYVARYIWRNLLRIRKERDDSRLAHWVTQTQREKLAKERDALIKQSSEWESSALEAQQERDAAVASADEWKRRAVVAESQLQIANADCNLRKKRAEKAEAELAAMKPKIVCQPFVQSQPPSASWGMAPDSVTCKPTDATAERKRIESEPCSTPYEQAREADTLGVEPEPLSGEPFVAKWFPKQVDKKLPICLWGEHERMVNVLRSQLAEATRSNLQLQNIVQAFRDILSTTEEPHA